MHRTYPTSSFSFLFIREPTVALVREVMSTKEVSLLSPPQSKLRAIAQFVQVRQRVDAVSQSAKKSDAQNISKRVCQYPIFGLGDWANVDKKSILKRGEAILAAKDPTRNRLFIKNDPYRVLNIEGHKLTLDVWEIHNFVSLNRIIIARTQLVAKAASKIPRGDQNDDKVDSENQLASDNEDVNRPPYYTVKTYVADRHQNHVSRCMVWWYDLVTEEDT